MKRYILWIVLSALVSLISLNPCEAIEQSVEIEPSVFVSISELGYDPGVGTGLTISYQADDFKFSFSGSLTNQHKDVHSDGYTFGYGPDVFYYLYKDIFIGFGYVWHGYHSWGSNSDWQKTGRNMEYLTGVSNDQYFITLVFLPDDKTVNHTKSLGISLGLYFPNGVGLFANHYWSWFEQGNKTLTGNSISIGVSYKFKRLL